MKFLFDAKARTIEQHLSGLGLYKGPIDQYQCKPVFFSQSHSNGASKLALTS